MNKIIGAARSNHDSKLDERGIQVLIIYETMCPRQSLTNLELRGNNGSKEVFDSRYCGSDLFEPWIRSLLN